MATKRKSIQETSPKVESPGSQAQRQKQGQTGAAKNGGGAGAPRWFSENEEKAWTERYFLGCSVFWLLVIGFVVVSKVYEGFYDVEYMCLGLLVSVPYVLYPLIFPPPLKGGAKASKLSERYWVKANLWLAVFGFIGNYFWTHYFYQVLGAGYSFPVVVQLNQVPFFLYLVTHAYFCFYHTLTNLLLRRFWSSHFYQGLQSCLLRCIVSSVVVFLMGYITAFMEAFTISSVPYYHYPDPYRMYVFGSVFYGIYFYVSFPMFLRLDESPEPKKRWTLSATFIDSLAACMAVTCLLDFWRLFIGHVAGVGDLSRLPLIATVSS